MTDIVSKDRIIVDLVNSYFRHHSELSCCSNKKLTPGSWEQIKENAEYEYEEQFDKEVIKHENKKS